MINTRNTHNLSDMLHGIITFDDGFDQRSAFSCYAATGASLNSTKPGFIVPGAMTKCLQLGRTLRIHQNNEQAMVQAVAELTGGIHLGRLRLLGSMKKPVTALTTCRLNYWMTAATATGCRWKMKACWYCGRICTASGSQLLWRRI
ncbi:hypothetical protein [Aliamphritea spongicola]|nr:hypothetical protein [Aliamphritea spongicola]